MPAAALTPLRRPDWRDRANCATTDPAWWDDGNLRGKTLCLKCPVLADCLTSALASEGDTADGRTGTRGGLTGPERNELHLDQTLLDLPGGWDAEEARIIALEAAATGRSTEDIAQEEGAGPLTARLAARLLGRAPEPATLIAGRRLAATHEPVIRHMHSRRCSLGTISARLGVRVPVARAALDALGLEPVDPRATSLTEQILERSDELLALRNRGLSLEECAREMGSTKKVVRAAWERIRRNTTPAAQQAVAGLELAS